MAGMSPTLQSTASRRVNAAINAPRWLMSWEDWLTFAAALVTFIAIAVSIQQARWVPGMPAVVPTMVSGLVIGLVAARLRFPSPVIHLAALALGLAVVAFMTQQYADGANVADRLADTRLRLVDWWHVVRANEISNDRLPFVAIVQAVSFLAAYLATYVIYRWNNPWLAILPGGVVLLANVALQKGEPTAALLVFLFGAMFLIARSHLQRLQRGWRRDRVDYPEFISLDAGQLTLAMLLAVVATAWMLPEANKASTVANAYEAVTAPFTGRSGAFDRLFHNISGKSANRLHDFGDFLPIRGDISLGTKRLYEVKAPEAGLIRGTSYDEYTGAGWKSSDRQKTRVEGGDLAASPEAAEYKSRVGIVIQVTALDPDRAILSAGVPLGTNETSNAYSPDGFLGDIEQLAATRGLREGDTYNSLGSVSVATPEELASAGIAYPDWVTQRYLQLPSDIPDRVGEEANRVAAGSASPYEAASRVEAYLREFPYDTTVPAAPHNRDSVDYFLFDLKAGYFDYSSSAMTVMLRTLGIPARVAVGYALDPVDASETTFTVRKNDAYSWVEVFFPQYGWVPFNPTPDRAAGGGGGLSGSGILDGSLDVEPNLDELFAEIGGFEPGVSETADALNAEVTEHNDPPWVLIYSLLGALVALVAIAFAGRLTWNWGLSGLEGPARMWARVQRLAGWAKLGGDEAETPREWARRVGPAASQEEQASTMANAFQHSRYGRPDSAPPTSPEGTDEAYRGLRNALLKLAPKVRLPGRKAR